MTRKINHTLHDQYNNNRLKLLEIKTNSDDAMKESAAS